MATKTDFTTEEWQVLQWAVADTMTYVSMSERGFFDTFKEAGGAARYVANARSNSSSVLVRDLAGDSRTGRDKEVAESPANIANEVSDRLTEAFAIVSAKAPDDAEAFREFIVGLAQATAEAADAVGATESEAIERVRAALA